MLHKFKPTIVARPEGSADVRFSVSVATFFGIGRIRPAPGTMGSLAALPIGFIIMVAGGPIALVIAALIALWLGATAAEVYGKKSGNLDDQSIVIDEVAGVWIAALPAALNPALWVAAFLLFRFFDIYKPWPASYFDRKKRGGWDVMLDDAVAGVFALCGVAFLAVNLPA